MFYLSGATGHFLFSISSWWLLQNAPRWQVPSSLGNQRRGVLSAFLYGNTYTLGFLWFDASLTGDFAISLFKVLRLNHLGANALKILPTLCFPSLFINCLESSAWSPNSYCCSICRKCSAVCVIFIHSKHLESPTERQSWKQYTLQEPFHFHFRAHKCVLFKRNPRWQNSHLET